MVRAIVNTAQNPETSATKDASATLTRSKPQIESIKIEWLVDEFSDASYIGEYTDNYDPTSFVAVGEHAGELAGHVPDDELPEKCREYRYFKPVAGDEKPATDKRTRYYKYGLQDFKQMDGLNRGDWCFLGCIAKAVIKTDAGRIETLTSGGLWGIESEMDEAYKTQVENEQIEELREHLESFGLTLDNDKIERE